MIRAHAIKPKVQHSLRLFICFSICSGAAYATVPKPSKGKVETCLLDSKISTPLLTIYLIYAHSPKSPNLIRSSLVRRMLLGLRSLWIIPLSCIAPKMLAICLRNSKIVEESTLRPNTNFSKSVQHNSITIKKSLSTE